MIDWDRLPAWLEQEIEKERERLTGDLDLEVTIRLRERIKTYRRVLEFGKEAAPEKSLMELVDDEENRRGYRY